MEKEITIKVKDIYKKFSITTTEQQKESSFYALQNISFEVHKGDIISIIGDNGSGKSTLLKILSNITKPTSGEVAFYGTTSSILDIGNNFLPDLTGRENILLQFKIKQIAKTEFNSHIRQILEFSEIGDFFDQQLKYYSSGMFLRLAFSMAFHIASDILILDEVLSVGDEGFRLKCQDLLKKLADSGKTIVFVSHNRLEILELSNKCIWIEKGKIKKMGIPSILLGEYFTKHKDAFEGKKNIIEFNKFENHPTNKNGNINLVWTESDSPGNEFVSIQEVKVNSKKNNVKILNTNEILISILLNKKIDRKKIGAFFFIQDVFYQPVLVSHFLNNIENKDISLETQHFKGQIRINCVIPANFLMPGKYYLRLRFGMEEKEWNIESEELIRFSEKLSFTVYPSENYLDIVGDLSKGSVRPTFEWTLTKY